jgi:hypothetical protein
MPAKMTAQRFQPGAQVELVRLNRMLRELVREAVSSQAA